MNYHERGDFSEVGLGNGGNSIWRRRRIHRLAKAALSGNVWRSINNFASFERPMSGRKLCDVEHMNVARLQLDFGMQSDAALRLMREIEKLRPFCVGEQEQEDDSEDGDMDIMMVPD